MTAAAAALPDRYRPDFAGFAADRREPDAIARLRRKAFTRFETLGLPTRQQEDWRLTDLSGLQQWNLQPPTIVPVDAGALPTLDLPAHRLAFVNGRYAPGLSQLREMPDQALVASIGQALLTHPELIVPYLDRLPGLEQHPFAALNTAFWEDGALVYLPPGTVVETPIHLIFHATGSDMAVYPRLLLVLDEGAQATVIVEYQGAGRYLNAPVTEARLGDDAVSVSYTHLDVYKRQMLFFDLGISVSMQGVPRNSSQIRSPTTPIFCRTQALLRCVKSQAVLTL